MYKDILTIHRDSVAAVDGTTPPGSTDAAWVANPHPMCWICRIVVSASFVGGTAPTVSIRPYLRDGTTVVKLDLCTYSMGVWVFDLAVRGWDVLMYVESVGGTPDSFDIDISRQWIND